MPPDAKRPKTDFCSDNSVSLPGILPGSSGPTGFEPGMFKNDDENSNQGKIKTEKDKDKNVDGQPKVIHFKHDFLNGISNDQIPQLQKKKKKDKKKHKHKHKHKHNKDKDKEKDKDKDKDKEKNKEKKDPNISRLTVKEETPETLSSAETSSNSNQTFQDLTSNL